MALDVVVASQHILGVMLDWLEIIVIIAIIYMLFQLVTGGKGVKDLFTGGKDDDGKDSDGRKRRDSKDADTDDGKKKKTGDEDEDDDDDFIDFDNLAQVRFIVRNLNDEPIEKAEIHLFPSKAKWFFKKLGKKGRNYTGLTNKDGIMPSTGAYLDVPSGTLKYTVDYTLPRGEKYKSVKGGFLGFGKRTFKAKSDVELKAGEKRDIAIVLEFYSEYAEGYEPTIIDMKQKQQERKLYVKGKIKQL